MATYEITGPDGRVVELEAPEGATPDQVQSKIAEIKRTYWGPQTPAKPQMYGPPAPPEPKPSMLESGARGALQGVTFGFSDEIGGAVGGAYDWMRGRGFNYTENRDAIRRGDDAARDANPWTYGLSELAGGLAVPVAGAAAAAGNAGRVANTARTVGLVPRELQAGTGLGRRMLEGARMGVPYGAATGLGQSEAETVGGNAFDAGRGALIGVAFGAAGVPVLDAAQQAGRVLSYPISAKLNPERAAAEQMALNLARDNKIGRLGQRAATAAQADSDSMLADLGDVSTARLMRAAVNQQNEANSALMGNLNTRQRFQGNKLERALLENLGFGERDAAGNLVRDSLGRPIFREFDEGIDALSQRLADIGRNQIEPALNVETPMSQQLAALYQRPTFRQLAQQARNNILDRGETAGLDSRTRELFNIKLILDTQIGKLRQAVSNPMNPDRNAGVDLVTLQTLRNDMMAAIPDGPFKQALAAYRGPAQLREAALRGQNDFMTMTPFQVRQTLARMSPEEQRMFRRGAAEALIYGRFHRGNYNTDKVSNTLQEDNTLSRLEALFPDNASRREFQKTYMTLGKQAKLRRTVQGNSTTPQQTNDQMDANSLAELARGAYDAVTGNIRGAVNAAARYGNRYFGGMSPEVAREIVRLGSRRLAPIQGPVQPGTNAGRLYAPDVLDAYERLGNRATSSTLLGSFLGQEAGENALQPTPRSIIERNETYRRRNRDGLADGGIVEPPRKAGRRTMASNSEAVGKALNAARKNSGGRVKKADGGMVEHWSLTQPRDRYGRWA